MADVRTTVVFRAEDQATPVFAAIGNRFKALKSSINQDAFKGWNKNFRVFRGSLRRVGSQLEGAAKTLAVPFSVAAGAIGFSLTSVIKNYTQVGDQLDKAIIRTGTGAEALQGLQYAASMAGSSAETMNSSLVKMNQNLANAAAGKNKELSGLFDALGVSITNADGSIKSASDLLPVLADAIQRVKDPALRTRMAVAAFGRQGAELIPMLEGGSEGLRQATERAKQLGLVMSEKQIKDAAALGDAFSELGMVAGAFGNKIGSSLAPALTALSGRLGEVLSKNREVFDAKITQLADKFAKTIEKIDFSAVIDGLFRFGEAAANAFEYIGGFKTVLYGFGAVFAGKTLHGVFTFASDLFTLGKAAYALVPAIKAVGLAISGAMGPIGLIGAAVAGAAALIYANWDSIGPKISAVWEVIKSSASNFVDWIGETFSNFWDRLDFSEAIKAAFNLSPAIAAFNLLPESWQNVLSELIARVESFFKDLWGRFTGFFKNLDFTSMLPDSVKKIASSVGGAFGKVSDALSNTVDSAKNWFSSPAPEPAFAGVPAVPAQRIGEETPFGRPSPFTQAPSRQTMEGELKIKVEAVNGATAEVEKASAGGGLNLSGDVGNGRIGGD